MNKLTKVEFHCHTSNSYDCDITLPERLQQYIHYGFTHIAITDHDSVITKEQKKIIELESDNIKVIPGIEVTTHAGHVILLGCTHKPFINSLFFLVLISKLFSYRIYIPHPCRKGTGLLYQYVINKIPTWYIAWFFRYVSYVEVWNPRDTIKNLIEVDTNIFKSLENVVFTAASDSHYNNDIFVDGCPMKGLSRNNELVERFFSKKIKESVVVIPFNFRSFLRYLKSSLRYLYKRYV